MPSRGPIPKPAAQRRGRNATEAPADTVRPDGVRHGPTLGLELHPVAVEWYEALRISAQSALYEPSDWASAKLITTAIHDYLTAPRPHALLLASITATWAELLVTEGGRAAPASRSSATTRRRQGARRAGRRHGLLPP